ncbi:MAG: hypothetical protein QXR53_03965 [Candidatus Norongarragalinales archaeon]
MEKQELLVVMLAVGIVLAGVALLVVFGILADSPSFKALFN